MTAAPSSASAPVAPVSTSAEAMPASRAMRTSVMSRSPTRIVSSGGRARRSSRVSAMCGEGLPTMASARAPVDASMAASIARAVGQVAVGGRAERVGVRGHDPGAGPDRAEGRQELRVVERAVPGDDDEVGRRRVVRGRIQRLRNRGREAGRRAAARRSAGSGRPWRGGRGSAAARPSTRRPRARRPGCPRSVSLAA